MKINNRFEIGDVVFYPSADLNRATLLKAVVTGLSIYKTEGKLMWAYQTGGTYGVREEDMFKTAKPAKRRLIQILKEKKTNISKNIDEAVKLLDAKKTDEIIYDTTVQYATQETDESQDMD